MSIYKARKYLVIILTIMFFININCTGIIAVVETGYSATTELQVQNTTSNNENNPLINNSTETVPEAIYEDTSNAVFNTSEIVDIDETYPVVLNKAGKFTDIKDEMFVRHVAHMPKFDDIVKQFTPPPGRLTTTFESSDITNDISPTVIDSTYKDNSVAESVYSFSSTPSTFIRDVDSIGSDDLSLENDSNVLLTSRDTFSVKNKKGLYTAAFTPESDKGFLNFSINNSNMLMSPLNPQSVLGRIEKNTITYENIYNDTDFIYTLEKNRLKEDIIVHKYNGICEYNFQLSVTNAVYDNNSNGEICFLDSETSEPLIYMAKPFAVDNKGDRCDIVNLEMQKKEIIKLSIDPEWLENADYPIIIDPTINIIFSSTSTVGSSLANSYITIPQQQSSNSYLLSSTTIFQASVDFSSVQGNNGWYYVEKTSNGYTPMIWDAVNSRWHGGYTSCLLWNSG